MARKINPNLIHLCESWRDPKYNGAVLEGSSRSGKTWSTIDFLLWLVSKKVEGYTINIIRETYNSFKTTLYLDFNKRLPMYGIKSPFVDVQERSTFKLFGNQFNLIGADKPSKFMGATCDIVWFNECIHIPQAIFDQSEMRCSDFWVMDYNPEVDKHWIYDNVVKRDNVSFFRSTFLDNPFVPKTQKEKILSYQPYHPDDEHKKEEDRRPHPVNVDQGTADKYMWDVFGLGKRAKLEGVIFEYELGQMDESLPFRYGLDFGYSDSPDACAKVAIDEKNKILYIEEVFYESEQKLSNLYSNISSQERAEIVADSAEARLIDEIRRETKFQVRKVKKPKGSIVAGIRLMQNYKIVICGNSENLEYEFDNYRWSDKNQNYPIDKHNHLIDGIRYVVYTYSNRKYEPHEPIENNYTKHTRGDTTGAGAAPWENAKDRGSSGIFY